MSSPVQPTDHTAALSARLDRIWASPPGWGALLVVNHTSIGLRFIITGFAFFLIGGVLALLIRSQLAFPGNDLLDHKAYAEAFTMHGTTMMFLFAVPIMEGLAVYLIPKMIGARDLIYPRLSAFGYWCYLFGGILLFASFIFDAVPDGGWFMYLPLNSRPFSPGLNADFWLIGVTFAEISAVAAGVELIVSILKTRTPGMTLAKMPLYAWYILITAFMIVFAFPPLILGSVLLELERAFDLPFYDAARGGDPLLWQHLFWIFGHPEVYIIFLPAAGLVTTILPTFVQKPMVGYSWVVLAVIATGFLSFGLWVHHMFAVGIPLLSLAFFSAASMAVAIPTGIQVFAWIATLWSGQPVLKTPLLFILGFLFVFVLGGLTGVMVALVPYDWQVHDTHFVVAHLHYVLFGGMVFPLFAALYYWMPLFWGKVPSEHLSRLVFWMIFLGFNLTFLPMHVTGLLGMPRRVYTYQADLGWDGLNLISSVGGFLSAAGVAMFVIDLALHWLDGRRAVPNEWHASSLEWTVPVPVPPYNFLSLRPVAHREPLWQEEGLAERAATGQHFLGRIDVDQRETLFTDSVHARPEFVAVLPGNTRVPLLAATLAALFFIGILARLYWLAAVGLALTIAALWLWAWQGGRRGARADDLIEATPTLHLPTHHAALHSPGWWGTLFTLMADATVFFSLLFAYFFLWTISPLWPPADYHAAGLLWPTLALLALLLSGILMHKGEYANRHEQGRQFGLSLLAAIGFSIVFVVMQTLTLQQVQVDANRHAYGALVVVITGYQFLHVGIAVLMTIFVLLRRHYGYVSARRPAEVRVVTLFWQYTVLQWLAAFAVLHLFPFIAER